MDCLAENSTYYPTVTLTNGKGSRTFLAGNWGAGTSSSITGSAVTRAGGGAGAGDDGNGIGGSGGGGNGGNLNGTMAVAGTVNTGSGGGGGVSQNATIVGAAGGSGIVILSYPDSYGDLSSIGAGLTYAKTTPTGYKVYTFTAGTGAVTF